MKKTVWILVLIIITNVLFIMPVMASEYSAENETFDDKSILGEGAIADNLYSELTSSQEEKLIFNETYSSYNELTGWKFSHDDHTASYIEDNAYIIKQLKSTPYNPDGSDNSTFSFDVSKDFTGVLEKDEENNTEIIATEFSGKYALEFDMEYYIDTVRANKTKYFMQLGYRNNKDADARTMSDTMLEMRLEHNKLSVYHLTSSGSKQTLFSEPCSMGTALQLKIVLDTRTKSFDVHKNGELVGYNIPFIYDTGHENVFSSMRIRGSQANSLDSYLKINRIKLYCLEADFTDERYTNAVNVFKLLPAFLTDDPLYVTDDIELPDINGDLNVRWVSGNTQAISNDGMVSRWVDDIDTYMQVSFSTTSPTKTVPFNYAKKYYIRIPALEGAETKIIMDEIYSQNEELNNWKFGSFYETVDGQYKIDNDELVFEKNSGKDDNIFYDLKSFYGIKTFYGEDTEYEAEPNSKLFSDSFSGVYDISITFIPEITGDKPAIVEIGYYDDMDNRYNTFGTIRFERSLVSFITETQDGLENNAVISDDEVSNKEFNIKIRIDTDKKKIWLYSNGIMITGQEGFLYYDSEDVNCFNALRISLDKNMNFGDLLKIKNIILEQKLYKSIKNKENIFNAAKLLNISVISDTPDNVVNSIKPLPSIIGNAQLIWETSNKDIIDIQKGKVYRADKDMSVTLRAKIIVGQVYAYKEFYLTVPKTEDPTELLEYYGNKLDISNITRQDINDIRYDIDLPVSFDGGTTIKWVSSDTSIMGNDGCLNLNTLIEDNANVNLTAIIEDNLGNSITKSFSINVRGRGSNVNIYNNEDINDFN